MREVYKGPEREYAMDEVQPGKKHYAALKTYATNVTYVRVIEK